MPFPETARVIYKNNTLETVICQLRFPTILKIDTELPALFQNRIRQSYPMYNENIETLQEFNIEPQQGIDYNGSPFSNRSISVKNYQFSTSDDIWKVNLTSSFIALSTSKYTRWEEFSSKLDFIYSAFDSEYDPPFFTRIGLRYVNIIDRKKLNLEKFAWRDLVKDQYLGFLAADYSESIHGYQCLYDIPLSDSISGVKIATTIARREPIETASKLFMIDSDFYCMQKIEKDNYQKQLKFLNSRSTRLIRAIITDKLHNAMEPQSIQ